MSWLYYPAVVPLTSGGAAQNLTPALFTNSQSFFAPTVAATYALTAPLFTNSQTFFTPTVTVGAVTLAPSLFANSQTFYGPTVSATYALAPALFTNAQTFHAATVAAGGVSLAPALFTNAQIFYTPTIAVGGAAQTLLPAVFENAQTFFAAVVAGTPVNLHGRKPRRGRRIIFEDELPVEPVIEQTARAEVVIPGIPELATEVSAARLELARLDQEFARVRKEAMALAERDYADAIAAINHAIAAEAAIIKRLREDDELILLLAA